MTQHGRESAVSHALGLGALTGVRSMAPAALVTRETNGRSHWLPWRRTTPERLLGSRRLSAALGIAALAEIVADKLPFVPARTDIGSLFGRALFGGMLGASVADMVGARRLAPMLAGATAAVASAAAAYHARRWLHDRTGVPDPALGLVEDAVVLAAGRALAVHLD